MRQSICMMTYLVHEYDEAITFFERTLGWFVIEDTVITDVKRWVRVAPNTDSGFALLLARAATPEQVARIGDQAGGRVFLFLNTTDFDRDHQSMIDRGVRFLESPRHEAYGRVAVFIDLYGNRWDLIETRKLS